MNDQNDTLDRLRHSADDGARSFRNAYISYLAVALYIFVTILSTTNELLLRAGEVSMPIINVGVPVVIFYVVVPWVLLILHLNLLVQGMFYASKVQNYVSDLKDHQRQERGLLFPAPIGHLLTNSDSRPGTRELLATIVVITLVALPLILLIYAQVRFLPYQNEAISHMHRLIVIIDLSLLWWLWPRITDPAAKWLDWWRGVSFGTNLGNVRYSRRLMSNTNRLIAACGSLACLLFIFGFANITGGAIDRLLPLSTLRNSLDRFYHFPNRTFVREEPSSEVLAAFIARETEWESGLAERGGYAWRKFARQLDLSERSFRNSQISSAYFYEARLQRTDFSGSNLWNTDFRAVTMFDSYLQGAFMNLASFQQANLQRTRFHGASMLQIRLEGTQMQKAELLGVKLMNGRLDGADLPEASLVGSNLSGAHFRGALLRGADLRGADLTGAQLQGADLRQAKIGGADLSGANLTLTDLRGIDTVCADEAYWIDIADQVEADVKYAAARVQALSQINERRAKMKCSDNFSKTILKKAICDNGKIGNAKCGFAADQEDAYFAALIPFLTKSLACPKGNTDIAAGIAYRIHRHVMIWPGNDKEKQAFRTLSAGLLNQDCPGAGDLPKWIRVPIERDLAKYN